jgi:hypothetical protein
MLQISEYLDVFLLRNAPNTGVSLGGGCVFVETSIFE